MDRQEPSSTGDEPAAILSYRGENGQIGVTSRVHSATGPLIRIYAAIAPAVLLVVLATGCGGNNKPEAAPPVVAVTPTPTPIAAVSLQDSCPKIEAALPDGVVPTASEWAAAAQKLTFISSEGDVETKNALEGLREAVDVLADDPERGSASIDARLAELDAVDNVATRCKAVGSSALQ